MDASQDGEGRHDARSAVVAAATELLRGAGADAVTTRAVAQAAGVQAPAIYRLFGDKDGLIDAVAEHVMAAYVDADRAVEDAADHDPVTGLRVGWRRHVEFGLANAELYALLNARARGGASPATRAGVDVLRRRVRRLAAAGLLRVDEERATAMIHAAGSGAVLALLEQPAPGRDLGLADAMLDAVLGAVLVATPVVTDPTTRTVAVTFATALPDLPGLSDAERALLSEWLDRSLTALRSS